MVGIAMVGMAMVGMAMVGITTAVIIAIVSTTRVGIARVAIVSLICSQPHGDVKSGKMDFEASGIYAICTLIPCEQPSSASAVSARAKEIFCFLPRNHAFSTRICH